MKNKYIGLDVLRGLGIFVLLMMHTAFYHFSGLYDLDLNNPPLVVTIIGLLLMFAGLFAMISGLVHTLQYEKKVKGLQLSSRQVGRYILKSGGWMLVIAYLYFNFTGPGIVNFSQRIMDESVLVHLINTGTWVMPSLERFLYIDSLVMIGVNILLVGGLYLLFNRLQIKHRSWWLLGITLSFFALSLVRIPLYNLYLTGRDTMNWSVILPLNWLVNKNNPILPYLAFGLMGMWLAMMLMDQERWFTRKALVVGCSLLVVGVILYITLPETMLQRAIDPVWFAIMMAQLGLFILLILGVLTWYDFKHHPLGLIGRFFSRFSKGGLSVFFVESLLSALVVSILRSLGITVQLEIGGALLFGLGLAIFWGLILISWERYHYRFGLEALMSRSLAKTAPSSKLTKLEE